MACLDLLENIGIRLTSKHKHITYSIQLNWQGMTAIKVYRWSKIRKNRLHATFYQVFFTDQTNY